MGPTHSKIVRGEETVVTIDFGPDPTFENVPNVVLDHISASLFDKVKQGFGLKKYEIVDKDSVVVLLKYKSHVTKEYSII